MRTDITFKEFLNTVEFVPAYGQLEMISGLDSDDKNIVVFQEARQLGMTTILSLYALYEAFCNPAKRVVMLSYNSGCSEQSKYFIEKYLDKIPMVFPIKSKAREIEFPNQSKIIFVSRDDEKHNSNIDCLIIDNANLRRNLKRLVQNYFPAVKEDGKIISDSVTFSLDAKKIFLRVEHD